MKFFKFFYIVFFVVALYYGLQLLISIYEKQGAIFIAIEFILMLVSGIGTLICSDIMNKMKKLQMRLNRVI